MLSTVLEIQQKKKKKKPEVMALEATSLGKKIAEKPR